MMINSDIELELAQAAWKIRQNAYAPYSGFKVGAALLSVADNEIICAVNVENSSFGATICAERSAVVKMIARFGKTQVKAIAIATDAEHPAVPCGMCLQVLSEFCSADMLVLLVNASGIASRYSLAELLPHPFTSFKS